MSILLQNATVPSMQITSAIFNPFSGLSAKDEVATLQTAQLMHLI